jgi:hypothetical protein
MRRGGGDLNYPFIGSQTKDSLFYEEAEELRESYPNVTIPEQLERHRL